MLLFPLLYANRVAIGNGNTWVSEGGRALSFIVASHSHGRPVYRKLPSLAKRETANGNRTRETLLGSS
jgi:hypothetical protein